MKRLDILKEMETYLNKEIKEEMKFKEDLHLDSIDLVELLMEIEDKYEIEISDENTQNITTVSDFLDVIEKTMEI